jgi:CRP-like cAMP-binding protein
LSATTIKREYGPGEAMCFEGSIADRVFVLRQGKVCRRVTPAGAPPGTRSEAVASFDEAGLLLGCEDVLRGRYLATLEALDGPALLVETPLDARGLVQAFEANPNAGLGLARSLARRLVAVSKAMNAKQRLGLRYLREFQGMCVDFCLLVQRLAERNVADEEIMEALSAARRTWAFNQGESAGADSIRQSRAWLVRIHDSGVKVGKRRLLMTDEPLCWRGDPGGDAYMLVSGRLSVRVGEEEYGSVRAGEMLGEIGALLHENEPRAADVVAAEPSLVDVVPGQEFGGLIASQPRFVVALCRMLCVRLQGVEHLTAAGNRALRQVANRFTGDEASFAHDTGELRRRLVLLMKDKGLPLQPEVDLLTRLSDRWHDVAEDVRSKTGKVH